MQQTNANRIIEVLVNKTKHNKHFAKVQFGSKRNFVATQNFKLSLILLIWLHQLQQYFLHPNMTTSDNEDWNKYGKYCGTTSNPMATSPPLANINFSKQLSPNDKDVIKNVLQFNPEEEKYGVCTSLEEWAFLILKWTFTHAYDADEECETRWNRASNMRPTFFISKN
jgi:hypothetical protein